MIPLLFGGVVHKIRKQNAYESVVCAPPGYTIWDAVQDEARDKIKRQINHRVRTQIEVRVSNDIEDYLVTDQSKRS